MRFLIWLLNLFPHVTIRRQEGPYLTRWHLLGGSTEDTNHPFLPFNLFLHCFHLSDEPVPHSHPWTWARALILRGSYREHRLLNLAGIWLHQSFGPGDVNPIAADTLHYLTLHTPTVWTLFLCGRKHGRRWGFLFEDGLQSPREYMRRRPGATSNEKS